MLLPREEAIVDFTAQQRNSGAVLEVMRYFARTGRPSDIAYVIQRYTDQLEMNRAHTRSFLAMRVPGILANHYFLTASWGHGSSTAQRASADKFFGPSFQESEWALDIVAAAHDCDPDGLMTAISDAILALQRMAEGKAKGQA